MDLLNAVFAFFGSLKPNDWVTAAISIAAVVVAVIALVRHHEPAPLMLLEESRVIDNNDKAVPSWRIVVANRGDGVAHDLRVFSVKENQEPVEQGNLPMLANGKTIPATIILSEEIPDPYRRWAEPQYLHGPVDATQVRLLVTWRQAPKMERPRRLRITTKTATSSKPVTWR